jgi:small subunit ribosomal protein S20
MPNIQSAKKRMRSNAKKEARNQATVSELKTLSQKLMTLKDQPEKARELASIAISRYDRAVTKGIIPHGRADRRKSRIMKFVARLEAPKAAPKKKK